MTHKKRITKIIASVLSVVMVLGVIVLVSPSEAQAISVGATDAGFYSIAYGENGATTFGMGDQIRVISYTRQGKSKNEAVYQFNGPLDWEPVGEDYVVWEGITDNTFYGVYPVADYSKYDSFRIPTAQAGGVQDADWMTDDVTANKSVGRVNFTFQHRLAKVTVNITKWNNEFTGTEEITEPKIYTKGINVTADYANGVTISTEDKITGITPYVDDTSYTAIVAPAVYNASDKFMTFTVDGKEMTVLATASQLTEGLEPGNHYTFDLTVGKDVVELTGVTVNGWKEENMNGGVAEAVEVTTVINGTTATLIIPKFATDTLVQNAVAKAIDTNATTLIIDGEPTTEQQQGIAAALTQKSGISLVIGGVTEPIEDITALTGIDLAYKNGKGDNGYAVVDNTYIITSKDGLDAWRTAAESNKGTNLTLACDIEYNAKWTMLYITYSGIIDGNGYAIVGLNCSGHSAAFIYELGKEGVIKHLGMVGGSFSNGNDNDSRSAAFVERNNGVIMGCYNTSTCSNASKEAYGYAAGIAFYNNLGTIIACYNAGEIKGGPRSGAGICHRNDKTLIGCYNTGTVTSNRQYDYPPGGIVYQNQDGPYVGTIKDCYYSKPDEGIGSDSERSQGTSSNLTKWTNSNWTEPMNRMNAAIEEYNKTATVKCNYRYVINTDAATKNAQPLIIVEVES